MTCFYTLLEVAACITVLERAEVNTMRPTGCSFIGHRLYGIATQSNGHNAVHKSHFGWSNCGSSTLKLGSIDSQKYVCCPLNGMARITCTTIFETCWIYWHLSHSNVADVKTKMTLPCILSRCLHWNWENCDKLRNHLFIRIIHKTIISTCTKIAQSLTTANNFTGGPSSVGVKPCINPDWYRLIEGNQARI